MIDKRLNHKNVDSVVFEPCQFIKEVPVRISLISSHESDDFCTLEDIIIILASFKLLSLRHNCFLSESFYNLNWRC